MTNETDVSKPILTKNQAKVIDLAIRNNDAVKVIKAATNDKPGWYTGKYVPLNDLPFETLVNALVNGYRVELTPEQKVHEFYESYADGDGEFNDGVAYGIKQTLDLLGTTIEGVNAPDEDALEDTMF
ncbi:hypothetical protein [Peribacillus frigoritolerans]|uniref:hypothetical protein n=1 Tax=Peribacillus frigoritolerans TaxID=450367 RepID=UPI002E2046C4|nr:hypothetical protein [Peribacillus frigoritolerans]MED3845585.1 hypothetical protein [Peribacillus frigoritolerans]